MRLGNGEDTGVSGRVVESLQLGNGNGSGDLAAGDLRRLWSFGGGGMETTLGINGSGFERKVEA